MNLRRLGKILGICAGGVLAVILLATLALQLALDRVPRYQAEIKAWVHRETGLYVRFAHVSAGWRWYGPELSFRQLQLRSSDDRRVLATAARGRIGSDLWRLLTSGRLFAARIELDSPDIVIARTGPTRFALAAEIPLQGSEAPVTALELDDLPPGILSIRHGRVTVTGWNRKLPRLVLSDVNLRARRDAGAIHIRADARLPAALGGEFGITAKLGKLAHLAALEWSADLRARDVSFPGWRRLLPAYLAHLEGGGGAFEFAASGTGRYLARASFDFAATNVVARASDGSIARFERISGDLQLTHQGERWTLLGRRVRALRAGRKDPPSQFDVTWRSRGGGALELDAHASYLRADNLLPLAALLPRESTRERFIAIAPTGVWTDAGLRLRRTGAGAPWRFTVHARFRDAGFGAFGRTPGLRGMSGALEGDQDAGHVEFATRAATVEWPGQWPRAIRLDTLDGTVYWSRTPAGLLIATPQVALGNRDARISLLASLLVPATGGSPVVNLFARLAHGRIAAVHRYLPRAMLGPKPLAWLDRAFLAGRVPDAEIVLRGPVRDFPFRDGSGLFLARLNLQGVTLDYAPGWPAIENAAGRAEFRDQSLTVHTPGATLGDLHVGSADARFADFKDATLTVRAEITGKASAALRFLRDTPIGRHAHGGFSAVRATGPVRAGVHLRLPFEDLADRRVIVHGVLKGVRLSRVGLPAAASALAGDFTVDGSAIVQADLNGRLLGGPLRVFAKAPAGARLRRTRLRFRGVATGAALGAAIGAPAAGRIGGKTPWRALLTIAPGPAWRRRLRVTSRLEGLTLDLPQPLAKRRDQPLPSWMQVQWSAVSAPVANFALGSIVRGTVALRPANGGERLARAAIAFGGAMPQFSDTQPIDVRGRIARLDLAGWHRLVPHGGGGALSQYLRSAQMHVAESDFGGLSVRDIDLKLQDVGDRWRITLRGPNADGTVSLPVAATRTGRWEVALRRLTVAAASPDPAVGGEHGPGRSPAIEPAKLPALRLHVERLIWIGQRFGDVRADLSTLADGVSTNDLTITGKTFKAGMHGDWRGPGRGVGHVVGSLSSSDVEATMADLGYARSIAAKKGRVDFDLRWAGAPTAAAFHEASGRVKIALDNGQVFGIKPGAGRVLGLASIAALPRRLALDFSDLTDKGLAFDTIAGTFELRGGNAYTNDVLLKGPAAQITLVGRIGLSKRDYDQTAVVTGTFGNSLPLAGVLAGGPVVGAAVLLLTQVFKVPLRGLARGYYHITGSWDNPQVERITSAAAAAAIAEGKQ